MWTIRKGRLLYVHVFKQPGTSLELPLYCEVESATLFPEGTAVSFTKQGDKIILPLPEKTDRVDYVFCLKTK